MSKSLRNLVVLSVVALLTTACAGGSANTPFETDGIRPYAPLTVQVKNNNWLDAVIWAIRGGTRFRLGEVVSQQQRTLEIPKGVLTGTGQLGVLVSLIGSDERFATGTLSVYPGQVISLQIQNHLAISSWTIYWP